MDTPSQRFFISSVSLFLASVGFSLSVVSAIIGALLGLVYTPPKRMMVHKTSRRRKVHSRSRSKRQVRPFSASSSPPTPSTITSADMPVFAESPPRNGFDINSETKEHAATRRSPSPLLVTAVSSVLSVKLPPRPKTSPSSSLCQPKKGNENESKLKPFSLRPPLKSFTMAPSTSVPDFKTSCKAELLSKSNTLRKATSAEPCVARPPLIHASTIACPTPTKACSEKKTPGRPRTPRTQPYAAPFFLPTPDQFTPTVPRKRSRTVSAPKRVPLPHIDIKSHPLPSATV